MFSERLENLIEAALQDGVLTEQEKASIVKRAQAEGEDIDEVEIYIQSLMQKRQQELNQKKKEANAIQAKEDQAFEKERSEKLRKCPKCGAFIPHLSNVCPECGFIIDSNETDKRITGLISILRTCLQRDWVDIQKSQYEEFKNCYTINTYAKFEDDMVRAYFNLDGILTEASLYEDNDTIKSLINEIRQNRKESLLKEISDHSKEIKYRLDDPPADLEMFVDYDFKELQKSFTSLKRECSDIMSEDEMAEVEGKISNLKKRYEEIINSPEYEKKVKRSEGLELFGGILGRLFWAIVLLLITISGWIIIILFFESGREWLKEKFDLVINGD